MADDCCNSFGGRVVIDIDGVRYPLTEANVSLDPTNIEVEAVANQDGSMARIVHPRLYGADIALRNSCGLVWNDLMARCKVNVSIVEEDTKRQHLFTGATIVGKPKINLSNGEVTGMTIAGPSYKSISA